MPAFDRATREPVLDEDGTQKISFMPKLQTSCTMQLSDGMVVKTHRSSELVATAQEDTLEFLLINHPLDCPICDQAGHCPLQNQAFKYGPEGSRFEFKKVNKPKQIELGPRVMLDGERCINCTRCTRYTAEVSGSHQLSIIERGVRNYPMAPPGTEFDEPYSMNVIDICPVGALTSRDYRFKARVWEVSKTPSISNTNAKGSNCFYWVKDNLVLNIVPRQNMDVNEYWLADEDRLDHQKYNENRPDGASIGGQRAEWASAYAYAADLLQGVAGSEILFIGSAHATVEDNYLLTKLASAVGASAPVYIPHVEPGHGDDWLRTDDRTPNAQGCERLGIQPIDEALVKGKLASGAIKAVYVLEDDPVASGVFSADDLQDVPVILHYYNTTNATLPVADVALPAAMLVETVGTYVNIDGQAQRVRPAKAIKGINRTLQMEMSQSRHDRHGTPFDKWHNEDHKIDCQPGWTSLPAIAKALGAERFAYKSPKAIMAEVEAQNPAFAGATYDAMGLFGVRLTEVGEAV
ncbi:MAG: 2Fe-2S iron-sulfur cluster-binding protein [Rhodothermales bacterium]